MHETTAQNKIVETVQCLQRMARGEPSCDCDDAGAHLFATASCSVWHTYLGFAPRQRRTGGGMPAAATSAAASTGVTVSYTLGRPHLRDLQHDDA